MPDGQDIVDYLVAHGAYVEAARLCVERQEPRRAIQLFERVWRFADAVPVALELGDRPLAVRPRTRTAAERSVRTRAEVTLRQAPITS